MLLVLDLLLGVVVEGGADGSAHCERAGSESRPSFRHTTFWTLVLGRFDGQYPPSQVGSVDVRDVLAILPDSHLREVVGITTVCEISRVLVRDKIGN